MKAKNVGKRRSQLAGCPGFLSYAFENSLWYTLCISHL